MAIDFKNLKKQSGLTDKLTKAIEDKNKGSFAKDDERFWQPEVDKSGNGYAIVRLLDAPAADGEDGLPWVQIFNHGFQGGGGWYIENCPTTVGGKCPACEHNNKLWNSGIEANKDIVRKQKRRLTYVSNILVVQDKNRPENEGKVFLWKYGKKIFDKIQEKLTPQFEDEKAVNPFDFWKGANLKIKIRNVEGYRNYDKSEFEEAAPVYDTDKEIEALWKNAHSLKQFVAAGEFKSYDDLTDRLNRALGAGGAAAARAVKTEDRSAPWEEPKAAEPRAPRATAETVDAGDDLDYFNKLAQD
jgi:hypothetical protein